MPYLVPGFKELTDTTKNLHLFLNRELKRYIPLSYEEMRRIGCGVDSQLAQEYLKLRPSEGVNRQRLDQIALINLIIKRLPETETDLEYHSNTLVLLGAYLHRYQRIGSNYTESLFTPLYVLTGTKEDNSALRLALETLLKIETKTNKVKGSVLDPLTVITVCEAFRDYLQLPANQNKFRYITKDPEFFNKLQMVINKARAQDTLHMEKQLNYVLFIQTVGEELSNLDNAVNNAIDYLVNSVSKHKRKESLSKKEILEILEKAPGVPEKIKRIIEQFFPPKFRILDTNGIAIPEGDKEKRHDSLSVYLREWFENFKRFTLLGAYSMVLYYCEKENLPQLDNVLKKSMGIMIENQPDNQLDNQSREVALSYFNLFTRLSTEGLRCTNWSDRADLMQNELETQIIEVREKIEAAKVLEDNDWVDIQFTIR